MNIAMQLEEEAWKLEEELERQMCDSGVLRLDVELYSLLKDVQASDTATDSVAAPESGEEDNSDYSSPKRSKLKSLLLCQFQLLDAIAIQPVLDVKASRESDRRHVEEEMQGLLERKHEIEASMVRMREAIRASSCDVERVQSRVRELEERRAVFKFVINSIGEYGPTEKLLPPFYAWYRANRSKMASEE